MDKNNKNNVVTLELENVAKRGHKNNGFGTKFFTIIYISFFSLLD